MEGIAFFMLCLMVFFMILVFEYILMPIFSSIRYHLLDIEKMKSENDVKGLFEVVNKYKGDKRYAAEAALIAIGKPSVLPLIQICAEHEAQLRKSSRYCAKHENLLRILSAIHQRDPSVTGSILRVIDENPSWPNRTMLTLFLTLANIGEPRAVELLIRALYYRELSMRRAAAHALVEMYQQGRLSTEMKILILEQRHIIQTPHNDSIHQDGNSHDDNHIDCGPGPFPRYNPPHSDHHAHSDIHKDIGIGVGFPL